MNQFDGIEILIVDNPNDAELTTRVLRRGHLINQIYVAKDSEEALDLIFCRGKFSDRNQSKSMKVILIDLRLPKVSGLKVLKEIKTNERTKKLPVLILTSSPEDPNIQSAFDLGVKNYVVKPVQFDAFRQAMNDMGLSWLLV